MEVPQNGSKWIVIISWNIPSKWTIRGYPYGSNNEIDEMDMSLTLSLGIFSATNPIVKVVMYLFRVILEVQKGHPESQKYQITQPVDLLLKVAQNLDNMEHPKKWNKSTINQLTKFSCFRLRFPCLGLNQKWNSDAPPQSDCCTWGLALDHWDP